MPTIALLCASNLFMTVAWYGHLTWMKTWPLAAVVLVSWLIALPEYCLAVPANRFGHVGQGGSFTAPQLKIIQEGLSIAIFVIFSVMFLKETPTIRDAAALALIGAGLGVALWK